MMVLCVKAEKKKAEEVRRMLSEKGLLAKGFSPLQEGGFVFFPVSKALAGFKAVEKNLERKSVRPRSLKEALAETLSENEAEQLVSAFDLVGDIAVIEIPDSLAGKKQEIAQALLRVHPSIRLVARKAGPRQGVFRLRELEILCGKGGFETVHVEHGLRFKLDVEKAYFSPRLAAERQRTAGLVKSGENVLVLFAGVGPFAIAIAKKNPSSKVAGIELNPDACRYFAENIALNKVSNCRVVCGDVRQAVPAQFEAWADRVLMPLPKGAEDFLQEAIKACRPGGIIHFYSFAPDKDLFTWAIQRIEKEAGRLGRKAEITGKKVVLPHAPRISQVVVAFRVGKPLR